MGVMFTVDGHRVHPESYTVQESSTPLAGGDSSGAIGTIEAVLDNLPHSPVGMNVEEPLSVIDTKLGSTLGTIREITDNRESAARYSIMASNRLGEFNIETQVAPFVGTLEAAFRYYCSLANLDTGIVVDSAIASLPVTFLGWNGNLWNHMKMMATAVGADLNLISNNVVLRPVRLFEAVRDRESSSTPGITSTELALKQEVIWYPSRYVTRGLVYPSGGWTSEVTPLSVNAGETTEVILDDRKNVDASIFSIEPPVAMYEIPQDYDASSVYSVVGDDGIPIQPAQWAAFGGKLTAEVSPDTRSIKITITGASGLVQSNGQPMRVFRIGWASGTTADQTYSTLRIVGRFVEVKPESIILPTGVPDYRTGQEFAPTIDNPFLNTLDAAYSAGTRGAGRYAGRRQTISASVTALNKRGVSGDASYPPYSVDQEEWAGMTYAQAQAAIAPKTYAQRQADLYASVGDNFDNQVFGNAPGARFWDRESGRPYRVREATTTWGGMEIEGDDDLNYEDMQGFFAGLTYAQVDAHYGGQTYYKVAIRGMA